MTNAFLAKKSSGEAQKKFASEKGKWSVADEEREREKYFAGIRHSTAEEGIARQNRWPFPHTLRPLVSIIAF